MTPQRRSAKAETPKIDTGGILKNGSDDDESKEEKVVHFQGSKEAPQRAGDPKNQFISFDKADAPDVVEETVAHAAPLLPKGEETEATARSSPPPNRKRSRTASPGPKPASKTTKPRSSSSDTGASTPRPAVAKGKTKAPAKKKSRKSPAGRERSTAGKAERKGKAKEEAASSDNRSTMQLRSRGPPKP